MWLDLVIGLGACVATVAVGLFIVWIVFRIKKTRRAIQSSPLKAERQAPLSIAEDVGEPSLEHSLNSDIQRETVKETETDDWLNKGVPEIPVSAIKKDADEWLNAEVEEVPANFVKPQDVDWLNAGVKEVPADVYKQRDDNWLNAGQLGTLDEFSLNQTTTGRPEIKIKQDGSVLDITVTAAKKQDIEAEKTVINLKINLPPQDLARKSEGPYDIEITTGDSGSSYQSKQKIIHDTPPNGPVNESLSLMDEISVRPVESTTITDTQLIDDTFIKPAINQMTASHPLMDEISVRPVESTTITSTQPIDDASIRPVINQEAASHALMDEISVKPLPGPVNIEYDLVEDLITKRAQHLRPEKVQPFREAVITNPAATIGEKTEPSSKAAVISPVESLTEKLEPVKPVSVSEITEFLKDKEILKQTAIPPAAAELPITPFLGHQYEEKVKVSRPAKLVPEKTMSSAGVAKTLAALRIYNNNAFYIQDTNLTNIDTSEPKPKVKDFTFKVINTPTELNELTHGDYDLVMDFSKIRRGLKKGMVAFFMLVDRELASMGWACVTEESKAVFRGYPYNDDLDRQACIVGDWTNPKFQESGVSNYVKYKRQQLLKEEGFTFERSIVDESVLKNLNSAREQGQIQSKYKRRTYTNLSLPGILGVEFWKEKPLNERDTKPPYKMLTLLGLVLPSAPRVADLKIRPRV